MGEFSSLYINDYEVDSWKNSVGYACELFTENDFIETTYIYDDEEGPIPAYQYVTTARNLISRLDVLGYTIKKVKDEFEYGKAQLIEEAKERESKGYFNDVENLWLTPPYASLKTLEKFYANYTFEVWLGLINKVLTKKIRRIYYNSDFDKKRISKIKRQNIHLYHILEHNDYISFGFPSNDVFYLYRGLLEVIKPSASVVLDFTFLVDFVGPENYQCCPPKTVILTEGSSDKRILEETLKILYPHLFDYYSFMDFDLANMPGSTGHLINIIKAFIATGVERKTIAIFDNDTAGLDAVRQLGNVLLPENMRIISLPHLDFARNYPTIGPQGQIDIDINGLACSIEMYLGQNILVDRNKKFIPIQWGGYMQAAKKYQGEITSKVKIQDDYLKVISKTKANPDLIKKHDWSGMHSIFQTVFNAFND